MQNFGDLIDHWYVYLGISTFLYLFLFCLVRYTKYKEKTLWNSGICNNCNQKWELESTSIDHDKIVTRHYNCSCQSISIKTNVDQ